MTKLTSQALKATMVLLVSYGTAMVAAAPLSGNVMEGSVKIKQSHDGKYTNIYQDSAKGIINWKKFSVGKGETVKFRQPDSQAITLNRDLSGAISEIHGKITANGKIILINPAGIFFGRHAQIDVGSILATTANISNKDFMKGHYTFQQSEKYPHGKIINHGNIAVKKGGLAALVAPGVENRGVIVAQMGTVVMAASNKYTVDFYGDGLINFEVGGAVKSKGSNALVSNSGTIFAPGGQVYMDAQTGAKVLDNMVNMKGVKRATSAVKVGGSIVLGNPDGSFTSFKSSPERVKKIRVNRINTKKVEAKKVVKVDNLVEFKNKQKNGESKVTVIVTKENKPTTVVSIKKEVAKNTNNVKVSVNKKTKSQVRVNKPAINKPASNTVVAINTNRNTESQTHAHQAIRYQHDAQLHHSPYTVYQLRGSLKSNKSNQVDITAAATSLPSAQIGQALVSTAGNSITQTVVGEMHQQVDKRQHMSEQPNALSGSLIADNLSVFEDAGYLVQIDGLWFLKQTQVQTKSLSFSIPQQTNFLINSRRVLDWTNTVGRSQE